MSGETGSATTNNNSSGGDDIAASNSSKKQTPEFIQAMKEARRIVEQREYDRMMAGVPAKLTPFGQTNTNTGKNEDLLLWKETHRLFTLIFNVLLTGVAVFVAVMYYADSIAFLQHADIGIRVLTALFAAMFVVAGEVFLIYRASQPASDIDRLIIPH